jgi:(1->4)-alpha-D-glucan 1-alpha-D-glucosylmutase
VPVATYRLQLTPEFGFAETGQIAGYLAGLGVTHVYLSPVLQAVPGSRHGYDVTDHSRIRDELGGEDGFREMAALLRRAGLGIVLDIVPNHMAVPEKMSLNRQLWSLLGGGPGSACANWFDVDWAAGGGRMLLPVLAGPVASSMQDLKVDPNGGPDGEPALRYFEYELPLRPGTAGLALPDLIDAQHYRLASWRDAATELNWRRFFDITELIAIRVEDPAVFAATHEVILRLVAEGLVDGLRVDHPDGLADPRGYLRRLYEESRGAWVVAEKILEAAELLPGDWACAGTTGYDSLRLADGLFVDPDGADALLAAFAAFAGPGGGLPPYGEVAYLAKLQVARDSLAPEVTRLARLLCALRPDAAFEDARTVLTEVLAEFGVYRAYAHPGETPAAASREPVRQAMAAASRRLAEPLRALAATVGDLALGLGGSTGPAAEFTVRFQQTTGPVLAKGIEDTASYRWPRLVALNEVGGDPDLFGVRPAEFYAQTSRLAADWPATMTTLSTHDTKRQEDVRARLAVLAEHPAEWERQATQWHEYAVSLGLTGVDPDTEYLLWQTLVGAWPIRGKRLARYLEKAMREAKTWTSWSRVDQSYEAAVQDLATLALTDPVLSGSIGAYVAGLSADSFANSLGAKLVQLTMPGVPDVYQGCELAGLYLVDPDNRRPVDFDWRGSLLADLDAWRLDVSADAGTGDSDMGGAASAGTARVDAAKLLVTSRALRLRRDHPDWFAGTYTPLTAVGPAADHAVAFVRGGHAVTVATRLPAGLRRRGGWGVTALPLAAVQEAAQTWVDVLTGHAYRAGPVRLAELSRRLPVALLVPEAFAPEGSLPEPQ